MSKQESKRNSSSSSKRSKNEHKSDTDTAEIPIEQVHTANNWESADLGDNQRKQKFLRLMGAKKRKDESGTDRQDSHGSNHSDEGSAEKKHCRSKVENEIIERELEKQFNEGLHTKIAHTHHEGLGFHTEGVSTTSSSGDWHHQSTKAKFVPAKTDDGSSINKVHVETKESIEDKSDNKTDKSSEKQEKKKNSKS